MSYIVTLELDADSFEWLNGLRRRYFPAAINHLDAHLTLFHKVDDDGIAAIGQALAGPDGKALALSFQGLRHLGRGVAIDVDAPDLIVLRAACARVLGDRMTRQDQQRFRPHVTIQNKVDPSEAKQLMESLAPTFTPRTGYGAAVLVWEYLGGPWRFVRRMPLR